MQTFAPFFKVIPLKDKFDLNFKQKFRFYLTPNTKHQAHSTSRNMAFKKLPLFILSKSFPYPRHEGVQGQWSSALIINLGTGWR